MKNYVVYDLYGKILRTGYCPDSMASIQALPGEFVIEGVADDVLDIVNDKKIVRKSKKELKLIQDNIDAEKKQLITEQLICERADSIIRKQAIDELRKEGKIV